MSVRRGLKRDTFGKKGKFLSDGEEDKMGELVAEREARHVLSISCRK